jgi:hypothetical protein
MDMRSIKKFLLLGFLSCPIALKAQVAGVRDTVVEFSGVTMTADSLRAVPGVDITVSGTNRGTVSNDEGVFTIVAYKGDVIQFTAVGFRSKNVRIPENLKGVHFSMIQLMVRDTQYLPVTIIRPYPSKYEFEYAFLHWEFPDDKYEIARKNTTAASLKALGRTLPSSPQEAVNNYFNQRAQSYYYNGQTPPQNIFNPVAWEQFINAWKRGDFKNQ